MKRAGLLRQIRVVEITTAFAGPYAGKLLGDLGADVIRVESTRNLDIMRDYPPYLLPDDPERSGSFASINRNKRSITVNLKSEGGREVAERLIARADVLLENFTPRVLPGLGLEPLRLRATYPRLVVCRMPGFGLTGPHRDYRSYGPTLEGQSGLAGLTGYMGEAPLRMGCSYPDMAGGVTAAFAVLCALRERADTGCGTLIELSQQRATAALTGTAVTEWSLSGESRGPRGNSHPWFVPHGIYRCAGADRWIAISVRHEAAWTALAAHVGLPGWPLAERQRRWAEIDAALEERTAREDADQLAGELQARGVEAAVVRSALELAEDGHLAARGFIEPIDHPQHGVRRYAGPPWRLTPSRGKPHGPAPALGQHTEELLSELGFAPEAVAALRHAGALS